MRRRRALGGDGLIHGEPPRPWLVWEFDTVCLAGCLTGRVDSCVLQGYLMSDSFTYRS